MESHTPSQSCTAPSPFAKSASASGTRLIFLLRRCGRDEPGQRRMPHGRGRRSQRLRTVSVRDISRQIHSSGHARLFQQRSSLFLQIIRHRGHLGGKTRYAARGARVRALQSGQHAVADAVAGICVRIIGGVRHMRHAAARQISQDIRPLRPQQRAHIRPAHRRDARGSAGRAAAGQIEQHRFGIVGAGVRRCDLRAVRLCQPCKKKRTVPAGPTPRPRFQAARAASHPAEHPAPHTGRAQRRRPRLQQRRAGRGSHEPRADAAPHTFCTENKKWNNAIESAPPESATITVSPFCSI